MRRRRALVWALVAAALVLMVSSSVLWALSDSGSTVDAVLIWGIAVVFAAVGRLIALSQPRNAIGWMFLGVAVSAGLGSLSGAYADYWVGGYGGSAGLARIAAWYESSSWIPFILVPATFLLVLFPDGHLPTRRWRPVAWCAAVGMVGGFVSQGLVPGKLEDYPQMTNPFAVSSPILDPAQGLSLLLVLVGIVGSAASLIVRFRRARGEERLQIKWLAQAGAVAAIIFPIGAFLSDYVGGIAFVPIMLSILGLPVAAGIAILRYRLYDIDVIINRTLVYGVLTATLAAAYLGSVLLLQLALSGLTAGSGLSVAASTLAVAGLFRPARSRIQELVDRRFYRSNYDAARTLETFAARLRDEVDLSALDAELRGVIAETMQPAHVSLWLRGPQTQ